MKLNGYKSVETRLLQKSTYTQHIEKVYNENMNAWLTLYDCIYISITEPDDEISRPELKKGDIWYVKH